MLKLYLLGAILALGGSIQAMDAETAQTPEEAQTVAYRNQLKAAFKVAKNAGDFDQMKAIARLADGHGFLKLYNRCWDEIYRLERPEPQQPNNTMRRLEFSGPLQAPSRLPHPSVVDEDSKEN